MTKENKLYSSDSIPFLRLIDTRGIELKSEFGPEKIFDNSINVINKSEKKRILMILSIASGIAYQIYIYIEDNEIEIIRKLRNQKKNIPIIIVYSHALIQQCFNNIHDKIKENFPDSIIIPVLAKQADDKNSFGLNELVEKSIEACKNVTINGKIFDSMKERITNIVGESAKDIWMGTFHSICVKILRKHIDKIGFDSSFIIFDSQDQKSLIKKCLKELQIDDKKFSEKMVQAEISNSKNEMLEPEEYSVRAHGDFIKEKIAIIYELYQKRLRENNAIDFDDIINFTIKIFNQNEEILNYYSSKFKYILVDEYQDTNKSQFTLVKMLANVNKNITVVGDNDQGIYSFRRRRY